MLTLELMKRMVMTAFERYGTDIEPCGRRADLFESFTVEGRHAILWYDDRDGSSHIVIADIDTGRIL